MEGLYWPRRRNYERADELIALAGYEARARALEALERSWTETLSRHPVLARMLEAEPYGEPPVTAEEARPYIEAAAGPAQCWDGDYSPAAGEVMLRCAYWWPEWWDEIAGGEE